MDTRQVNGINIKTWLDLLNRVMPSLREIRFLLEYNNSLRKVCKIFFSSKDASLYLTPYAFANEYYYGEEKIPEGKEKLTFNYTDGLKSKSTPKLSIHYSRQIHVDGDEKSLGSGMNK